MDGAPVPNDITDEQLAAAAEEQLEAGLPEPFPEADTDWEESDWHRLVADLVESGLITHKEVGAAVLGHLNPPQVGTSIASADRDRFGFKDNWEAAGNLPRTFWRGVRTWLYQQSGRCIDCGTRLDLQADHVESRVQNGRDADRLQNMTLRCRRHNVVRRESHKKGGLTYLTAESALMWLLLVKRPTTYQVFEQMCRSYGLTMANIRFQEAWAMARWLQREGRYEIDEASTL